MFGSDLLYNALNVTAITGMLDEYMTGKALFSDKLVPQDFTSSKSINFYMSGVYNASLAYNDYTYSVNCRADNYEDSRQIALAIKDEINRSNYPDYFITVSVLETIPPQEQTDNYNTPLEAVIKAKP